MCLDCIQTKLCKKNLKKEGENKNETRFYHNFNFVRFILCRKSNYQRAENGGDNSKLEAEIGKVLRDYYDAFSPS